MNGQLKIEIGGTPAAEVAAAAIRNGWATKPLKEMTAAEIDGIKRRQHIGRHNKIRTMHDLAAAE